jgi:hypothetical protein
VGIRVPPAGSQTAAPLAVHRRAAVARSSAVGSAPAARSRRHRAASRRRAGTGGARTRPGADLPCTPPCPGGGRGYPVGSRSRCGRASARRALALRAPPPSLSDHQFRSRSGRPAQGAPRRRRTGLSVSRLSDPEPSRSSRPRTNPLDVPCSRRAPACCGPWRHRRRRRPAPPAPHLPGRRSDRRPRLTAMCLFDHSVSRLP